MSNAAEVVSFVALSIPVIAVAVLIARGYFDGG